jgi:hypothetical protein
MEMKRLDRVARIIRNAVMVIFALAMLYNWVGLDVETPRPGPGHDPAPGPGPVAVPGPETPGSAAPPAHAAVRWIDIEPSLPAVRSETRFETRDRKAGKAYVGTAFATGARDVWATARHVAEGCRRVGLRHGRTIEPVTQMLHHRGTDLSLLIAHERGGIEPASDSYLPLETPLLDGFAMGYPGGNEATGLLPKNWSRLNERVRLT